jgi:DNA-binding CsgD family transcriptional regulator
MFRLTPAESRLLRLFYSGHDLKDAAAALGVAEATARTHQISLFSKVGVSGWPDLMMLVSRLLPPIVHGGATPHPIGHA